MKIIYINTVYGSGSTGKITASLYNASLSSDFEASVAYGRGRVPSKYGINGLLIGNRTDFCFHVMKNFFLGQSGFGSKGVTAKLISWLKEEKPDLLHLHNLHGFYVHVGMLFEYIKEYNIPVVWTLHDCWPFTGNCAFFDTVDCRKWETGCHDCPIYRSDYPYSLFKDNSKNNYLIKKKSFTGVKNLTVVTPCSWLNTLVKRSFLSEYEVITIYNGIDTSVFSNDHAISVCNYPQICALQGKKIILGVASIWEKRKGLEHMLRLSEIFNDSNDYHVVIIGLNKHQCKMIEKRHHGLITAIERTEDQKELAAWYRSSYVYVNPTLQDNFPTTNIEALSCGTPVITFRTGGSPEAIGPDCGFVVDKEDFSGLCDAIKAVETISSAEARSTRISYASRFDQKRMLGEYRKLYQKII